MIKCGFCNNDIVIGKWTKELDSCCSEPMFMVDSYGRVCYKCGQIDRISLRKEYVDYYDVSWKLTKRSYYVCKRLDHYDRIHRLSVNDRNRIVRAFEEISKLDRILLGKRSC